MQPLAGALHARLGARQAQILPARKVMLRQTLDVAQGDRFAIPGAEGSEGGDGNHRSLPLLLSTSAGSQTDGIAASRATRIAGST